MSLKWYVYISDDKVDMLYPQIPKKILDKIAVELGINLGMFSLNVKGKENQEMPRTEKLKLVVNYIENNMDVGTVDEPKAYFKGLLPMSWGILSPNEETVVYFGGRTEQTILGLSGLMAHVVGSSPELPKATGPCSPFIIAALYEAMKDMGFSETDSKHYRGDNNELLKAIILETRVVRRPIERFEFLARIAVEGTIEWEGESVHVVLGTPVYVAYAE